MTVMFLFKKEYKQYEYFDYLISDHDHLHSFGEAYETS